MGIWICLDIGSTWTKATAVDPDAPRIVGTSRSRTTVETDVNLGVSAALAELVRQCGHHSIDRRLACSSAAGGLRMAAVGLVPELTAEAARRAAFSAGAKVIRTFSHELTAADLRDLDSMRPDILLLCGGTDGGNRRVLLHNAAALASLETVFPVVLAGNRSVAEEAAGLLRGRGKPVRITENVMPEFNRLNLEPAREAIREVFLERIVKAKGLDKVASLVDDLLMPTPFAVLNAVRLLAEGYDGETGWGDLMALDVGGATTDVYSMAAGEPSLPGVLWKGLPEPYAKRTVEGDLGVRLNAQAITETLGDGLHGLSQLALRAHVTTDTASDWLKTISENPGILPESVSTSPIPSACAPEACSLSHDHSALDSALAIRAMQVALQRHAGKMEEAFTPMGRVHVQTGKDLTGVRRLILTGGPLVDAFDPAGLANAALSADPSAAASGTLLLPDKMDLFLDKSYILAAMGLLAAEQPLVALRIMKKEMIAL